MATTPTQAIPYCGPNDAPDVPYWMQRLAERVAVLLDALGVTVAANTSGLAKASKGTIYTLKTSATSTGLFNSPSTTDSIQATLVQDRWYRATYRLNTVCPTAANVGFTMDMKKAAVNDVAPTTGTNPADGYVCYTAPTMNQGNGALGTFTWKASASETCTLKMILNRVAGSATYNIDSRHLVIEDLGAQV